MLAHWPHCSEPRSFFSQVFSMFLGAFPRKRALGPSPLIGGAHLGTWTIVRPCRRRPERHPTAEPALGQGVYRQCCHSGGPWSKVPRGSAPPLLSKQPWDIESGLGLSCVELPANNPWPSREGGRYMATANCVKWG